MVSRRGFIGLFGAAAAGVLLEEAIPFGRVWSFPKNIVIAKRVLTYDDITRVTLEQFAKWDYAGAILGLPTFRELRERPLRPPMRVEWDFVPRVPQEALDYQKRAMTPAESMTGAKK